MRFGERLRKARTNARLTQAGLAVKIKNACTQENISRLERSKTAKGSEHTVLLAEACGVSAKWLSTGEGEMYEGKSKSAHWLKPQKNIIEVPTLSAEASMGLGKILSDYETVVDHLRLTKDWVRAHLTITNPSNLAVLTAYGDSMTPTFSDGDILLVDRGVDDIKLDAVYVLALRNELFVKRIQRRITDGAIVIKSDNPLYDQVVIENGQRQGLAILGRVVWSWNGKKL